MRYTYLAFVAITLAMMLVAIFGCASQDIATLLDEPSKEEQAELAQFLLDGPMNITPNACVGLYNLRIADGKELLPPKRKPLDETLVLLKASSAQFFSDQNCKKKIHEVKIAKFDHFSQPFFVKLSTRPHEGMPPEKVELSFADRYGRIPAMIVPIQVVH